MQRCVSELFAVPIIGPPARGAMVGARVVVLGGTTAARAAVGGALARQGARASILDRSADAAEVAARSGGADIVVDLNVTGSPAGRAGEVVRAGAWRGPLRQTYDVLRTVAEDWARETRADRCFYVVVNDFGGRLGSDPHAVRQPLGGIWAGLAKTLPRELANCNVRVVDVADGVDVGAAVVAEIAGGGFIEVGWEPGRRSVLLPRPAPAATETTLRIAPGSVVVVTGGARGIGYRLARALRDGWGCQVVVTGREELRDDEPAYLLDDEGFQALRRRRLLGCASRHQLRQARLELSRLERGREAWRGLAAARSAGGELVYRRCDVTSRADVASLLDGLRGPLAAVVHNAGIDLAARIESKTDTDVDAVVSTKVDGFLNLHAALEGRSLPVMCAVGSLTGRYGGTAGQTDYAGANEGLARLTEWAGARGTFPVTCLSWPTWDSVGLITNPTAAVREMSAMAVSEGITAWERELRSPYAGEVLFLGEVRGLSPGQLRGLPIPSDYPGSAALAGRRSILGQLVRWRPGEVLETRHVWGAGALPAAGIGQGSSLALPVSLLLELAVDAGSWLRPVDAAEPAVLTGLDVHVQGLRLDLADPLELARRAVRRSVDGQWLVDVELMRVTRSGEEVLARVSVTLPSTPTPDEEWSRAADAPSVRRESGAVGGAEGSGQVMVRGGSGALVLAFSEDSRRVVVAERISAHELFGGLNAPQPRLPAALVEGVLWASRPPDAGSASRLRVERVGLLGDASRATYAHLDPAAAGAVAREPDGAPLLTMTGIRWLSEDGEAGP